LEASASGLPIVGSRVGVLPNLVQHELTGLLTDPGHIDEIAQTLRRTWLDQEESAQMGAAARSRMEAEFKEEDYAKKLAELLSAAVQRAKN
jgi:glycosyltransferase involved in cell wall biosynthesis